MNNKGGEMSPNSLLSCSKCTQLMNLWNSIMKNSLDHLIPIASFKDIDEYLSAMVR